MRASVTERARERRERGGGDRESTQPGGLFCQTESTSTREDSSTKGLNSPQLFLAVAVLMDDVSTTLFTMPLL